MERTVVITGASRGIGYGLAAEFAGRGHSVVIAARDRARVEEAVAGLQAKTGDDARVGGAGCDVARREDVQALWDYAAATLGRIDLWINNAGLARTVWAIADVPQSEVEAMITINMLGTINGCRVAAAGMLAQGDGGKIFNVLGGGSNGEYFPGLGVYGTTKRGLDYFTDALVRELKGSGILVGKIRPGMIITDAVLREARADLENFQKSRKFMNNLADRIETVAPYLVDEMLKFNKSGAKIAWLNPGKIAWRMLKGRFRDRPDQFAGFGL